MPITPLSAASKVKSGVKKLVFNPFEMAPSEDSGEKPLGFYDKTIFEHIRESIEVQGRESVSITVAEKKTQGWKLEASGETLFRFNHPGEEISDRVRKFHNIQREEKLNEKREESFRGPQNLKKENTFKEFRGFVNETVTEVRKTSEKTLKLMPDALFKDLIIEQTFGLSLPGKKTEQKKPKTKEEAEKMAKEKADAIALYQAYRRLDEIIKATPRQEEEEITKLAIGELGGLPTQEHAKIAGLNTSIDVKHLRTKSHIKSIGQAQRDQQKAAQRAQKQESMAKATKPVADLNAITEGGRGKGQISLSTTGGGGVG